MESNIPWTLAVSAVRKSPNRARATSLTDPSMGVTNMPNLASHAFCGVLLQPVRRSWCLVEVIKDSRASELSIVLKPIPATAISVRASHDCVHMHYFLGVSSQRVPCSLHPEPTRIGGLGSHTLSPPPRTPFEEQPISLTYCKLRP